MKLPSFLAAATIAFLPFTAHAVPLGQLDISGNLDVLDSSFTPTGSLDFTPELGVSSIAEGIFSDVTTVFEAVGPEDFTLFTLFDIQFNETMPPQKVYEGAGFAFFATSFSTFDNDFPGRAFNAGGFVTGAFGSLPARFSLSTQTTEPREGVFSFSSTTTVIPLPASVLLLLSAIGGLGVLSRSRKSDLAA